MHVVYRVSTGFSVLWIDFYLTCFFPLTLISLGRLKVRAHKYAHIYIYTYTHTCIHYIQVLMYI